MATSCSIESDSLPLSWLPSVSTPEGWGTVGNARLVVAGLLLVAELCGGPRGRYRSSERTMNNDLIWPTNLGLILLMMGVISALEKFVGRFLTAST